MLKYKYATKEEIPADLPAGLYAEVEGAWIAQLEGATDVSRLAEFRDQNIALQKTVNQYKPLEGKDIAEVLKAVETVQNLDDKKLVDAGKVEELVASRLEALTKQHKLTVDELTGKLGTTETRLAKVSIEGALLAAGTEYGVKKTATQDLLLRGGMVFQLDAEGNPVAQDAKGNPMYADDGITPMTPKLFVEQKLTKEAAHLFDENHGSGAAGVAGVGGEYSQYTSANPYSKEHYNSTTQGMLQSTNFALAKRLASQHGITLKEPSKPLSVAN